MSDTTRTPRQYSYVRYNVETLSADYQAHFVQGHLQFSPQHRYIYMGEIPNMPGYCVVADDDGNFYTGYPIENFIELTDDEMDDFAPVGYNP